MEHVDIPFCTCNVLFISIVSDSFCDTVNCSPQSSSVPGVSQTKALEWVASSLLKGSFSRDQIPVWCRQVLFIWAWEARTSCCCCCQLLQSCPGSPCVPEISTKWAKSAQGSPRGPKGPHHGPLKVGYAEMAPSFHSKVIPAMYSLKVSFHPDSLWGQPCAGQRVPALPAAGQPCPCSTARGRQTPQPVPQVSQASHQAGPQRHQALAFGCCIKIAHRDCQRAKHSIL